MATPERLAPSCRLQSAANAERDRLRHHHPRKLPLRRDKSGLLATRASRKGYLRWGGASTGSANAATISATTETAGPFWPDAPIGWRTDAIETRTTRRRGLLRARPRRAHQPGRRVPRRTARVPVTGQRACRRGGNWKQPKLPERPARVRSGDYDHAELLARRPRRGWLWPSSSDIGAGAPAGPSRRARRRQRGGAPRHTAL